MATFQSLLTAYSYYKPVVTYFASHTCVTAASYHVIKLSPTSSNNESSKRWFTMWLNKLIPSIVLMNYSIELPASRGTLPYPNDESTTCSHNDESPHR